MHIAVHSARLKCYVYEQVHSLCTRGRYRESFDSFWNLQAELQIKKISAKMIGLTATLRPRDVNDVMRRMAVANAVVFRQSCHREGLKFKFERGIKTEKGAVERASMLATEYATTGRVLVFASTVHICNEIGVAIRSLFSG